jgi:hypothetical protein
MSRMSPVQLTSCERQRRCQFRAGVPAQALLLIFTCAVSHALLIVKTYFVQKHFFPPRSERRIHHQCAFSVRLLSATSPLSSVETVNRCPGPVVDVACHLFNLNRLA